MSMDPTYSKIIDRRRRTRRLLLSVALLITGGSMLIAALFRQSTPLAIVGIAVMAIAGQLPGDRRKRSTTSND
jgi:energy-converting hydrogenase Eha subunit H